MYLLASNSLQHSKHEYSSGRPRVPAYSNFGWARAARAHTRLRCALQLGIALPHAWLLIANPSHTDLKVNAQPFVRVRACVTTFANLNIVITCTRVPARRRLQFAAGDISTSIWMHVCAYMHKPERHGMHRSAPVSSSRLRLSCRLGPLQTLKLVQICSAAVTKQGRTGSNAAILIQYCSACMHRLRMHLHEFMNVCTVRSKHNEEPAKA